MLPRWRCRVVDNYVKRTHLLHAEKRLKRFAHVGGCGDSALCQQIVLSLEILIERLHIYRQAIPRQAMCIVLLGLAMPWMPRLSAAGTNDLFKIVQQGKPTATIVIPVEAPKWTKTAADWLVEYVNGTCRDPPHRNSRLCHLFTKCFKLLSAGTLLRVVWAESGCRR